MRRAYEERPAEGHSADKQRLLRPEARQVARELGNEDDHEGRDAREANVEKELETTALHGQRERREEREPGHEDHDSEHVPGIRADEALRCAEGMPLEVAPDDHARAEALGLRVREAEDVRHLVRRVEVRRPVVDERRDVDLEARRDHPDREHRDRADREREQEPVDAPPLLGHSGLRRSRRLDCVAGRSPHVELGQYAPRRARTAGIVLAMIVMSTQIDQFSMYVKSSRTRSSKVSPERPEICQRPVIPGSTA